MTISFRVLTLAMAIAYMVLVPQSPGRLGPDWQGAITGTDAVRLNYFASPSAQACRAQCENNANCKGFTWIKPGTYNPRDPAMCYLMSNPGTSFSQNSCCVSAVASAPRLGPDWQGAITGNDAVRLTYFGSPSAATCRAECEKNSNCAGYTWIRAGTYNPRDAAMCYLMSTPGTSFSQNSCCMSAVKGGGGNTGGGVPIDWGRNYAAEHRGKNGQRFTYSCPGNGRTNERVWGTDIYTDDSSICTAAVHVGLITFASGGTVTIEIRPDPGSYTSSARNGVTSEGFGGWRGSFVFVR
jgi:hypothetical protein